MNDYTGRNTAESESQDNAALTRREALGLGATAVAGVAAASLPGMVQTAVAQQAQTVGAGELAGQVALVTGGARGIGRACAVALARAGADVAILDIGRDIPGHKAPLATTGDMAETARLVHATGRRALTIQADIRDMAAMRAAAERTVRELGRIDILFANAGISGQGTIAESSDDDWRRTVDVNIIGTANSLRAVAPSMMARGAGRIIVTVSTFGRQGTGAHVPYATEKWGLVGMVKSAALELGKNNITVNAVAPTGVVTGFGGPQSPQQRAQGDEFFRTQYHALPVGALQPEDIGGTVVFLASPAARYITGVVIDVAAGANARYTG